MFLSGKVRASEKYIVEEKEVRVIKKSEERQFLFAFKRVKLTTDP